MGIASPRRALAVFAVVGGIYAYRLASPRPSEGPLRGVSDDEVSAQHVAARDDDALAELSHRLRDCEARPTRSGCSGLIYVWTPAMPLSENGKAEIADAASKLGLRVDVLRAEKVSDAREAGDALAATLVSAGATVHAPAVVTYEQGRVRGSAIVGFKTAAAYEAMLAERVTTVAAGKAATGTTNPPSTVAAVGSARAGDNSTNGGRYAPGAIAFTRGAPAPALAFKDYPLSGQPGAYFRWVPGRDAVAFETGGSVYLLDLADGRTQRAPGFVDFVPTPDGRFFVTPGPSRVGLEFYDAEQVFANTAGRPAAAFFADAQMQDQYPSVGILEDRTEGTDRRTVYRVLTSWIDRIAFRDYEVRTAGGRSTVRPLGAVVDGCRGMEVSIPIIAPTGREVAARDERTATTWIFELANDGTCKAVTDLGVQSGKVAWSPDAKKIAFAVPRGAVSDGSRTLWVGADAPNLAGVFVFDRTAQKVALVDESQGARRLAFPEFVGADRILFALPSELPQTPNRFRLVCCVR
jgi:hypothetical protein